MTAQQPTDWAGRMAELQSCLADADPHQPSLSVEALLDVFLAVYMDTKAMAGELPAGLGKFVKRYERVLAKLQSLRINLNDFELIKPLAKGAFATVCLVRHKVEQRPYALKILKKKMLIERREAAYFMEERNALVFAASSKWITSLYAAFQDEENLYLVMEYAPGGSLRSMTSAREYTLTEDEARFYVAEIILALEELHGLRFVHRDLKPENCLIDATGHIKLADFGSCIRMDDRDMVTSLEAVGTPDYIPPEVLRSHEGKMTYGRECDCWSLGVIVYELLHGETPFCADNVAHVYSRIMNHAQHLKVGDDLKLSSEAKDLILRLLTDKDQRLGRKGVHEIKSHPWFRSIQWDAVGTMTPPFVPSLQNDEDTTYFEDEEMDDFKPPMRRTVKTDKAYLGNNLPFIGYSYFEGSRPRIVFSDAVAGEESAPVLPAAALSSPSTNDAVVQQLQKDLESAAEAAEVERTRALAELRAELEKDHRVQCETLQRECDESQQRIRELEKAAVAQQMESTLFGEQVVYEQTEKERALSDARLADAALRDERARAAEATAALEAKLRVASELAASLRSSARDEAAAAAQAHQTMVDKLQNALEGQQRAAESVSARLAQMERANATLETELEQLRAHAAETSRGANSDVVNALQIKLDFEISTKQGLLEEMGQLTHAQGEMRAQVQDLQRRLVAETERVAEGKRRAAVLEESDAARAAQIVDLADAVSRAREEARADAAARAARLEAEELARRTAEARAGQLERSRALLGTEVDDMRARLEQASAARQQAEARSAQLKSEHDQATKEFKGLRRTMDELQREMSVYQKEVARMSAEKQTLQNDYRDLEDKYHNVCQLRNNIESEYDRLERTLQEVQQQQQQLLGIRGPRGSIGTSAGNPGSLTSVHQFGLGAGDSPTTPTLVLATPASPASPLRGPPASTSPTGSSGSGPAGFASVGTISQMHIVKTPKKRFALNSLFGGGTTGGAATDGRSSPTSLVGGGLPRQAAAVKPGHGTISISRPLELLDQAAPAGSPADINALLLGDGTFSNKSALATSASVASGLTSEPTENADGSSPHSRKTTNTTVQSSSEYTSWFKRGYPVGKMQVGTGASASAGGFTLSKSLGQKLLSELGGSSARLGDAVVRSIEQAYVMGFDTRTVITGVLRVPKAPSAATGKTANKSAWKRKHIVLRSHQFAWFESVKDGSAPEGALRLDCDLFIARPAGKAELAVSTNLECIFKIHCADAPASSPRLLEKSSADNEVAEKAVADKIATLQADLEREKKFCEKTELMLQLHSTDAAREEAQRMIAVSAKKIAMYEDELQTLGRVMSKAASSASLATAPSELVPESAPVDPTELRLTVEALERQIVTETRTREGMVRLLPFASQKVENHRQVIEQNIADTDERLKTLNADLQLLRSTDRSAVVRILAKHRGEATAVLVVHGHRFLPKTFQQADACVCESCNDFLWRDNSRGYECELCHYTVHRSCEQQLDLSCADVEALRRVRPYYFMCATAEDCHRWLSVLNAQRRAIDKMRLQPLPPLPQLASSPVALALPLTAGPNASAILSTTPDLRDQNRDVMSLLAATPVGPSLLGATEPSGVNGGFPGSSTSLCG